jgi:Kef-type K+ transport system membrane component KefB
MSGGGPSKDFITLLIYWACAYLSAVLAAKTRLSPLLFYLLLGCILGNCNVVHSSEGMHFLSEIAITIVFLALGFEENVHHFIGGIKKAWGIASIGAIVPFGCGFGWAYIFYADQGIYAMLMCGLAVTATAVSLTMISLKSEGLAVSKPAIGIMTSAVLDDVMCLALVAIMVPIATGAAEPTVFGIGFVLAKSGIFFSIIILLHMLVFPQLRKNGDSVKHKLLSYIPGLRSVGVHMFMRFKAGEQAVLAVLAIGLAVGGSIAFQFPPCYRCVHGGTYPRGALFRY